MIDIKMVAFSKDSFINDCLWFIDFETGEKFYLVNGSIVTEDDRQIINERGEANFLYLLSEVIEPRYVWYYGRDNFREIIGSLDLELVLTGDGLLEKVCEEIDYSTIRDADCPYRCEGCLLKRTCTNCGDQISHCKALYTTKHTTKQYYCSDDCWTQDSRDTVKPKLVSLLQNADKRMQRIKKYMDQLIPYQKGKNKLIRFTETFLTNKGFVTQMLRKDLEKNIKLCKNAYRRELYEYNCFQSLLQRDRASFDTNFQLLQELYVDAMAEANTDDEIMKEAHKSKINIQSIQNMANWFVGTSFSIIT